jgi:hypothetical protein
MALKKDRSWRPCGDYRSLNLVTTPRQVSFTKQDLSNVLHGCTIFSKIDLFFTALAANGLAINLEKCGFATPSLEILGHRILTIGAAPTIDHAAEIKNCPPPQDIKQLQHFLGMVNFYHSFLPTCAQVLKPLTYSGRHKYNSRHKYNLSPYFC